MGNGGTAPTIRTLSLDNGQNRIKKMEIVYRNDIVPDTDQIIDVYNSSGINRPTSDIVRIGKMYSNSNLVLTAWDNNKLIGISRSLTDFCYCCYLSDLAVRKEYQKRGIGNKLIQLTKDKIGEQTALILLSAPTAMEYYPKIGFEKIENGFIIKRTK
jgi:predicted N-acetyltransferase YhbS